MLKVTVTEFRANIKEYINSVLRNKEDLCITNKKENTGNVVVMSEKRYDELMRSARFASYLEMIRRNEELIKATKDIDDEK